MLANVAPLRPVFNLACLVKCSDLCVVAQPAFSRPHVSMSGVGWKVAFSSKCVSGAHLLEEACCGCLLGSVRCCGKRRTSTMRARGRMSRHRAGVARKRIQDTAPLHTSVEGRRQLRGLLCHWTCKAFSTLESVCQAPAFFEKAAGLHFSVRCRQHAVVRSQLAGLKLKAAHRPVQRGQASRPAIGHVAALERAVVDTCSAVPRVLARTLRLKSTPPL